MNHTTTSPDVGALDSNRHPPVAPRTRVVSTFFKDVASSILTVVFFSVAIFAAPKLVSWLVVHATWTGSPSGCSTEGACWAFIHAKFRFILFGVYPPQEQWRPTVVLAVIAAISLWTLPPKHWNRRTAVAWVATVIASIAVLQGGFAGLTSIPTSSWGGLPLTVLLTIFSVGLGFPLAVFVALGQRSEMVLVRWVSRGFVELMRGIPLVSLLFIASVMLPIILPENFSIDKLARAVVALVLFSAAYLAEVLRGGFQGIDAGQFDAAKALGLRWSATVRLITLPLAIRNVIPSLTNTLIVMVKNTSLVVVVGVFDLMSTSRVAAADPDWASPYKESYLFVGLIYLIICFGLSRYALWLENRAYRSRGSS